MTISKLLIGLSLCFIPAMVLHVGQSQNCNTPMWPCALHQSNAQLTTAALPSPMPFSGLVGANQCVKTAYGTTLCRCTDVNTQPSGIHSSEVQDGGGATGQPWNKDGTMVKVLRAASGTTDVMLVDPVAKKCSGLILNSEAFTGSVWDANDGDGDYTLTGTAVAKRQGFRNPQGPTTTQLADLAKACPLPTLPAKSWHAPLSTDGNVLLTAFSTQNAQDTGIYAVAYQLSKGGCQVFNTQAGTFSSKGGYGAAGKATGTNGFTAFTIHDLTIYGGGWATIGGPQGQRYLWKVGTTTVNLITEKTGGHDTMGYNTFVNLTNSPRMAGRLAKSVNTTWFISSDQGVAFPQPQETHPSWRNADWNETRPILSSQVSQNKQLPIQIAAPLEDEVYGADPKTGTYLRLAPTLTSGICNRPPAWDNFRTCNAIIAVAPKDAPPEVAFSSDGMGGLGNTDGKSPNCILGAPSPNSCRSDVFIVWP